MKKQTNKKTFISNTWFFNQVLEMNTLTPETKGLF